MTKEEIQKNSEHWYEKYKEVKHELAKKTDVNNSLVGQVARLEIENAELKEELKAQIEKMKCCTNCKHTRTEYKHCLTEKLENWELIEESDENTYFSIE
jgi:hypothetical protein